MTDGLQKVRPGDTLAIPASTHNAFVDAARAHRAGEQNRGRQVRPALDRASVVWIKNTTGGALNRFYVVGLGGPVFTPSDESFFNEIGFDGVTPATASHVGLFAVLLEPLASGAIGLGMVSGVAPVQLNVIDADHEFADVKDGDATVLETGDTGMAQILYKESGTGTKWALVRIGTPAASVLPAGDTGDILYHDGDDWVILDVSAAPAVVGDVISYYNDGGKIVPQIESPVTPS